MLALALLAAAPLHFHFQATEFQNAVYHVACLTGSVVCTNSAYSRFWNEEYGVTRDDGARLDEWKSILNKVQSAAVAPEPAPFLPNYLSHYPSLVIRNRIIAAALESSSGKEFPGRASKLVSPEDARRLGAILDHFQQRLHPWWAATGRKIAESQLQQIQKRIESLGVERLASQMAEFLEAGLPRRDVYIHAIPGPSPKSAEASANPIQNHFSIEIIETTKPEAAASVALHELVHALYEYVPAGRRLALMREFRDSRELAAQSYYEFLNEALATGAQLLLLDRNGIKEDDPYHDPYIPRLGVASMSLLKEALANRRTLFDGFVTSYLHSGAAALREDAAGPKFMLAAAGVLSSKKNEAAAQTFFAEFKPRFWVNTEEEWTRFENLNGVRLLTYDELAPFAGEIPNLDALMGRPGFVYVKPRGTKGKVVFLAGRDLDALNEVVKRLATPPSISPTTVMDVLVLK